MNRFERTTIAAGSLSICLATAAVFCPTISHAQPLPSPSGPGLVPPGPYSSWSAEARERVPGQAHLACVLAATMGFAAYTGPKDLGIELTLAQTMVCLLKTMPTDWPDRATTREQALKHSEAARALDSLVSIPVVPDN
jgi:hypothetical protein